MYVARVKYWKQRRSVRNTKSEFKNAEKRYVRIRTLRTKKTTRRLTDIVCMENKKKIFLNRFFILLKIPTVPVIYRMHTHARTRTHRFVWAKRYYERYTHRAARAD